MPITNKFMTLISIAGAIALVGYTSGFICTSSDPPSTQWVLKSDAKAGSTLGSCNASSASNCQGQIHFCALRCPSSNKHNF